MACVYADWDPCIKAINAVDLQWYGIRSDLNRIENRRSRSIVTVLLLQ